MENLEQLRAAAALAPAQTLDRSAVSILPAMILTNGLLATAAFCAADGGGDNRADMKRALDATAEHLSKRKLLVRERKTTEGLIEDLVAGDSQQLQRATTEALALVAYLKRFTPKPPKKV